MRAITICKKNQCKILINLIVVCGATSVRVTKKKYSEKDTILQGFSVIKSQYFWMKKRYFF